MSKELKILYVEDDKENREELIELLSGDIINGYEISMDGEESFIGCVKKVNNYHIVILDLFEGKAGAGGNPSGLTTLEEIRKSIFIPIIFYSGNTTRVNNLRSQVIGVATKGEGMENLKSEIERLTQHNLPYLRENIHKHIENEFRKYFWDVIQKENNKFNPEDNDYSLGYLLLRNIGNSLSKENIANVLEDTSINQDKVHPMEFYIYPIVNDKEFENGEIIQDNKTNEVYAILTPSCDFVKSAKRKRKAKKVLLAKTILLKDTDYYAEYMKDKDKKKDKFAQYINSGASDRFFFLPATPFIENRVIDFHDNIMVEYELLNANYTRIAKLDNPFAQSMTASFIRYYNRIGFPDIDVEYVLNKL